MKSIKYEGIIGRLEPVDLVKIEKELETFMVDVSKQFRVETGPIQFGDDWCGVFIRGDDCFYYLNALEVILKDMNEPNLKKSLNERADYQMALLALAGLKDLLSRSQQNKDEQVQKLYDFCECKYNEG